MSNSVTLVIDSAKLLQPHMSDGARRRRVLAANGKSRTLYYECGSDSDGRFGQEAGNPR